MPKLKYVFDKNILVKYENKIYNVYAIEYDSRRHLNTLTLKLQELESEKRFDYDIEVRIHDCVPLIISQDEMLEKIKLNGDGLRFGILRKNKSDIDIEHISLNMALNYDYSEDLIYETKESYIATSPRYIFLRRHAEYLEKKRQLLSK